MHNIISNKLPTIPTKFGQIDPSKLLLPQMKDKHDSSVFRAFYLSRIIKGKPTGCWRCARACLAWINNSGQRVVPGERGNDGRRSIQ